MDREQWPLIDLGKHWWYLSNTQEFLVYLCVCIDFDSCSVCFVHVDTLPLWAVPKSPSAERLRNGGVTPLCSAEPSPALPKKGLPQNAQVKHPVSCWEVVENVVSWCNLEEVDAW